jgi:hypothetical protein
MWSTPDLADISLVMKGLLDQAISTSPLKTGTPPVLASSKIKVSCDSPETVRKMADQCYLTLYLLHIGRDPYWRNTQLAGPRPQLNSAQPLSLNLSYLLTAFCDGDFATEQLAMSIALQAIQSNPIMNAATTPTDPMWSDVPDGEFVISIEADTIEEMSRLWQAFTVPIRLSALIRASVIFIAAPAAIAPPMPPPATANLAVGPEAVAGTPAPVLVAGYGQQAPPVPAGTKLDPKSVKIGPPVAVAGLTPASGSNPALAGSRFSILGNGLDQAGAASVYLSAPGGVLWDVTAWRQGVSAGELDLALPGVYADPATPPPAAAPWPGLYQLSVGSGGVARSNPVTIAIAPRVDGVTNPPLLNAVAGVYTVTGGGFAPAAAVSLALGTAALALSAAAAPSAGNFVIGAGGTALSFVAPSALAKGFYPMLLAVNGIAASIGWVVVV